MKKVIGILVVALISVTTSCTDNKQGEKKNEMHNEMNDNQTNYACPMHPEVTGKQGEKCSKCGMDLVAVEKLDNTEMKHDDGHDHDHGAE